MIKNLVTISLIVFIVIVVGILGTGLFSNQNKPNQQTNSTITGTTNDEDNNPNDEVGEGGVINNNPVNTVTGTNITMDQVAQHNNSNDCWVIISNKVYNVTSYINIHPAGPEKIIPYCGKNATTAFDTKGGKGSHSQEAQNLLNTYYVGNLSR